MTLRAITTSLLASFLLNTTEGRTADIIKPGGERLVQGTVLLTNTRYFIDDGRGAVRFITPKNPGFYTWADLAPTGVSGGRPGQNVLVIQPVPTGLVCAGLPAAAGAASAVL